MGLIYYVRKPFGHTQLLNDHDVPDVPVDDDDGRSAGCQSEIE